ncbi:MAG: hypothetical protein ACLQM8_14930 [Limisphaerales bacterium]
MLSAHKFAVRVRLSLAAWPAHHRRESGIQDLGHWILCALGLVALLAGPPARAQEALQMSAASAQAAEARKKAGSTLDYTNLLLGPTLWNFKAQETTVFTDNVGFSHTGAESDLIFRPELATHFLWPISPFNNLTLGLGVGYSAYVRQSQWDRFFLSPGTETSFDLYSGDFWINLHDRFSLTDNAFQDATYAGSGDYQSLENTAGVAVTWDMNKLVFKSGFDYVGYDALTDNLLIRDQQSELFTLSGSYAVIPSIRLGVELSYGLTSYSWVSNSPAAPTIQSDATQWSAGAFAEAKLSANLAVRGGVGYTALDPQSTLSLGSRQEGPYARIGFAHRLNQYFDHGLTLSRDISFSPYGGLMNDYLVAWSGNWHTLRKITFSTSFVYQHGSQAAYGAETYDWLSPRLFISRPITRRLTAKAGYSYYHRTSTLVQNQYNADLASLNLEYQF